MNTSEVIVAYLAAAGIRHVFGYPGDPSVELLEAARRAQMDFVLASREGTAGLMAEAYGQLTGRPGVCLSTLGPGSTNLVNAVASAYLDRVPMIAISGQIETRRERTAMLKRWTHHYNWHRPHQGIGGVAPISRLKRSRNNLLTLHS